MKLSTVSWIAAIACAAVVGAQQAPPPAEMFGERVDVEVVNVDVVVTDRKGGLVTDLAEADFTLLVDGRPVAIEYFSRPRAERAAEESGEVEAPEVTSETVPSNLLVFVDQSALEIRTSDLVLEQLREFVTARAAAGDRVLIAAFSDNLRILAPGTSDPAAVGAALDELDRIRGRGSRLTAEREHIEREIRLLGQGRTTPGSLSGPVDTTELANSIQSLHDQEVDRQRRLMESLKHWIGTFAGMDGRKSLLLATPGFTANPTAYLSELADSVGRTIDPDGRVRRGSLQSTDVDIYTEFDRLLLRAQDARIAVYTLAPREAPPGSNSAAFGSVGPGSTAPPPRDQGVIEAASSLARLADATGGRNFSIDKALASELEVVAEENASAYSLGFTTGAEAGTKLHTIAVKVNRDGVQLRHREAYRRDTLAERVEEALAAAASVGITDLSFTIRLEPGAPKPSTKKKSKGTTVPVAVRIPISAVTLAQESAKKKRGAAPGDNYEGHLSVRFAVRGTDGNLHFGEPTEVTISVPPADLERARSSDWVHRGELELKTGEQRVAAVVVDEPSGLFATTSAIFDVPEK